MATITNDTVRGDVANALTILELTSNLAEDIGAVVHRLRSALHKIDTAARAAATEPSTVGADADRSNA